eukprot:2800411-Rhodomonas_salina.1
MKLEKRSRCPRRRTYSGTRVPGYPIAQWYYNCNTEYSGTVNFLFSTPGTLPDRRAILRYLSLRRVTQGSTDGGLTIRSLLRSRFRYSTIADVKMTVDAVETMKHRCDCPTPPSHNPGPSPRPRHLRTDAKEQVEFEHARMLFSTDKDAKAQDPHSGRTQNELQHWIDSLGSALFCADIAEFTRICDSHTPVEDKVIAQSTRLKKDSVTAFSPMHPPVHAVRMPDSASKLRVMKPDNPNPMKPISNPNGEEVVVGDRVIVFPKSPSHHLRMAALENEMMKEHHAEHQDAPSPPQ